MRVPSPAAGMITITFMLGEKYNNNLHPERSEWACFSSRAKRGIPTNFETFLGKLFIDRVPSQKLGTETREIPTLSLPNLRSGVSSSP